MKKIQVILLTLIIFGVGLLLTQKFWVPPLVSIILKHERIYRLSDIPEVVPAISNVSDNGMNMEKWNWVLSEVSPQGTQFMYPNPLPTRYVKAQDWPPLVEMSADEFSCTEGNLVASDGSPKHFARHVLGEHTYCVATSVEGAAGSTYTNYEYFTPQGDFLVRVIFTLQTPQCLNYDEPERGLCQEEQASFNVDALVDRIASSIRMQ